MLIKFVLALFLSMGIAKIVTIEKAALTKYMIQITQFLTDNLDYVYRLKSIQVFELGKGAAGAEYFLNYMVTYTPIFFAVFVGIGLIRKHNAKKLHDKALQSANLRKK